MSHAAEEAEKAAPGDGSDAVVWEQVVRTTAADSTLSISYLAFLTIATMLAARWCWGPGSVRSPPWPWRSCTVAGPSAGPRRAPA
ncbi:hypothetical protein [Geodermatophilus sp. URMC 64]